jgi:hypothetical protein
MDTHSHKDLCTLAVGWLQRPHSRKGPGCTVAVAETANAISKEIPDAIGWRPFAYGRCGSVLVEVKVSRADFLADAAKPHRAAPDTGMGAYRYYLAPEGLIKPTELPPRWGLIEVNARGHLKVLAGHVLLGYRDEDTWRHTFNQTAEVSLLALCLTRVGDAQKFQQMLRDANNRAARLEAQAQEQEKRSAAHVQRLIAENARLRGEEPEPTQALPRRASSGGNMLEASDDASS